MDTAELKLTTPTKVSETTTTAETQTVKKEVPGVTPLTPRRGGTTVGYPDVLTTTETSALMVNRLIIGVLNKSQNQVCTL